MRVRVRFRVGLGLEPIELGLGFAIAFMKLDVFRSWRSPIFSLRFENLQ